MAGKEASRRQGTIEFSSRFKLLVDLHLKSKQGRGQRYAEHAWPELWEYHALNGAELAYDTTVLIVG